MTMKTSILFIFLVLTFNSNSQIHCGTVELVPNTSVNELATFDEFSYYQSGYNINSVAKIPIPPVRVAKVLWELRWLKSSNFL